MKKITAILLGTLIVSSAALANTNQVLSKNAVGYVKRTVPGGGLDLMTVPFVNLSQVNNTVSNTFPSATDGTQISLWSQGSQTYRTFIKAKGTWGNPGTNVLARGDAVFFRSPSASTQEVFIMGEVPDSATAPTTTVTVISGLNAVGLGYPVSTSWTGTTLAASLPDGSQISVWNGSAYTTIIKAKGSWGASGNSLVIDPGDGFFVRSPVGAPTINWNQTKPYTWP